MSKENKNHDIVANYFHNCVMAREDDPVLEKYGTCCRVYVANGVPWKELLSGIQEVCKKHTDSYEISIDRIVYDGEPEDGDGTSGYGCQSDLAGAMGRLE